MTSAAFVDLAKSFKVGGVFGSWEMDFDIQNAYWYGSAHVVIKAKVFDRDTGLPTPLYTTGLIPLDTLDEAGALHWLKNLVETLVMHELHENLRVGGKLLWDPHLPPVPQKG